MLGWDGDADLRALGKQIRRAQETVSEPAAPALTEQTLEEVIRSLGLGQVMTLVPTEIYHYSGCLCSSCLPTTVAALREEVKALQSDMVVLVDRISGVAK